MPRPRWGATSRRAAWSGWPSGWTPCADLLRLPYLGVMAKSTSTPLTKLATTFMAPLV